jgi:LuxR family maltose regulon positive regulatory protein
MRARGQMVEIRQAELRFTKTETLDFLQRVMEGKLSADDITALHHRTEGWITGLHLAALSIQGREDAQRFVQTFTAGHHYILDYLLAEVFQQQSESGQTFLLQTSILERLCSSLCDAVTGRDNGQTTLEMLAQANLFILPLDDKQHWYRYHHLFADLLRHRLQQTLPAQWSDLHRRAATWHEQHGFIAEAIDHALQAEAYPEAARLVEANAFATLKQGEVMTVLGWLDRLPQETVPTHPWLSVWRAWTLSLTGQVAQIEPALAPLVTTAEQTSPSQEIQGHLCAIRAYVAALSNEPARAMELAQQTLARLLIAQGKPEEALALLARLHQAAEVSGRAKQVIETLILQALALQTQGDISQAMVAIENALSLAEPEGYIRTFVDEGRPMAELLGRMKAEG